jgi:hypothetical protein
MPPAAPNLPAILPAIAEEPQRLFSLLERFIAAVESHPAPQPPALYLTLAAAREYSGLSLALLRRLVHSGELPSIRDGALKVRRVDLDNFASSSTKRQGLAGVAASGSKR